VDDLLTAHRDRLFEQGRCHQYGGRDQSEDGNACAYPDGEPINAFLGPHEIK
jgi:hypothetical protein